MRPRITGFAAATPSAIARTAGAAAVALAVAMTAGAPTAATQPLAARGVIARVTVDECAQPPATPWRECRGHQAYAGTIVSARPTTRVLRTKLDVATGRIHFRGHELFTGCVADRCGTLRFGLVGSFRLDANGRPRGSGLAEVIGGTGALAGTTGSLALTLGYPTAYRGRLTVPGR